MRVIKLHHQHEFVTTQANTAGVRSKIMEITPPNGVFVAVARLLQPVIKLLKSGGGQISPASKVYVGKKRPGDSSPEFAPGVFTLQSFSDLTTAQQRSSDNRATLTVDLGKGIGVREQETIVIEIESPDVVDFDQAGTAFEFPAEWDNI